MASEQDFLASELFAIDQ